MKNLEFLSDIALMLVSSGDPDSQIKTVLEKTGRYINVSRVYVFEDSADGSTTSNTYEWCAEGISSQIGSLQNIPYSEIRFWMDTLRSDGMILSENIDLLPPEISEVLKPQGILSVLVYPLYREQNISGFIGFDQCAVQRIWGRTDIALLKTVAGMISSALERNRDHETIKASERNFKTFFNTVDDLMMIGNMQGNLIYANSACEKRLGYSHDELMGMHILQLHPEDIRKEAIQIRLEFQNLPS
ncbi:MAG TPA: PAS domain S-box protein [Chitinispirillaceae bacterium]|nr:PAS domain S-box protein [Chitinispirillaceae bacterium]